MGRLVNFVNSLHNLTKRNYLERMVNNKVACMKMARNYGYEYWDGDRCFGYGGYNYIPGRWKEVAKKIIDTYQLDNNSKLLDLGCGKGYLLHEIKLLLPEISITGMDISDYALQNSTPLIKPFLQNYDVRKKLSFSDQSYDLVISLAVLHNFKFKDLEQSIYEIERVGKNKYIMVESYQDEFELFNLQCWALTAESFFDKDEWIYLLKTFGYTGDYEFIYFK